MLWGGLYTVGLQQDKLQLGAPVHPVAVIYVHNVINAPNDGFVDVAADHAIKPQPLGLIGQSLLIPAHHLDGKLALRIACMSDGLQWAGGRVHAQMGRTLPLT